MSIALSTLVLFFLLVPGIAFRRFYYSEEFSREYFKETFFAVFIATIIPSLFFQFLWYQLVNFFGFYVDLSIFGDLISSKPSNSTFENIEKNSLKVLTYNLTMFLTAGFTGYMFKQIVRKSKLDRKHKFFRFQNSWHYILKGEFFDFPRAEIVLDIDKVEDIEFVFVDVIVEINSISYIYDGVLVDYELSNDGGLDTISIANAQRRKLTDDAEYSKKGDRKDNSHKYYSIDGHILVLKYCEIKNLNFIYYTLEYEDEIKAFLPRKVE